MIAKFRIRLFLAILRVFYFFEYLCEEVIKKIEFKLFLEGVILRAGRGRRDDVTKYLKFF